MLMLIVTFELRIVMPSVIMMDVVVMHVMAPCSSSPSIVSSLKAQSKWNNDKKTQETSSKSFLTFNSSYL
jgi:hypothetical protein